MECHISPKQELNIDGEGKKEWKDQHGMPDITKTRSTTALPACKANKHKKQKRMHCDTFQREK